VDLYEAKDRIAVALAEAIFRRARYEVRPFRPDPAQPRFVREDFLPSLQVSTRLEDGSIRAFVLDVSYRPFVEQLMALENQRKDASIFILARRHWPNLRSILVTDHPEPGRSCFQTVAFEGPRETPPLTTANLAEVDEFRIFPHNVADHEHLMLRIFAMLAADRHRREPMYGPLSALP
jgi:hypothetical protein